MSEYIKPSLGLTLFRPDEVAECWENIPEPLYVKLWALVPHYKPGQDIGHNCVADFWDDLTDWEKEFLNRLDEGREREEGYYWVTLPWGKAIVAQWDPQRQSFWLPGHPHEHDAEYFSEIGSRIDEPSQPPLVREYPDPAERYEQLHPSMRELDDGYDDY